MAQDLYLRGRFAWNRRTRASLEEAVRQITYNTATMWGLHDRGLLREGMAADVLVFDPEGQVDID